jgi:hypothetical protein
MTPANAVRWSARSVSGREFLVWAATRDGAIERLSNGDGVRGELIDYSTLEVDARDAWKIEVSDERKAPGA